MIAFTDIVGLDMAKQALLLLGSARGSRRLPERLLMCFLKERLLLNCR